MSTKSPIEGGDSFNLYEDKFDEENVYLELPGVEFRAACNWEGSTHVTMSIPHEVMDNIARAWLKHRKKQR